MSSFTTEFHFLFWILVAVCGTVAIGIAAVVVFAAIRYHRKRENEIASSSNAVNIPLEVAWTAIPFILFMGMFAWGAILYFDIERPPDSATDVYVVAKQWMWKTQHLDGTREIDELHVPVNQSVRLLMISQDVIHSFYVPAFHIKQDVLPDRFTTIWFRATEAGRYHLFCAEYCGTNHSTMTGWVYALDRQQYEQWRQQSGAEGSLASTGEKMFHQFGCANCHHFDGQGRCPNLKGLYGTTVHLAGGGTAIADENYIRRKLADPRATTVEGYDKNVMPDFSHQLSDDQIVELIAYIRSLGPQPGATLPSSTGTTPDTYGAQPGISYPGAPSLGPREPGIR